MDTANRFHLRAALLSTGIGLLYCALILWQIGRQAPADRPSIFFETPAHIQPALPPSGHALLDAMTHLDAHWYLNIAVHGYRLQGTADTDAANVVFFPLFPYLIRAVSSLTSVHPSLVAHGLAFFFFLAACFFLPNFLQTLFHNFGHGALDTAGNSWSVMFAHPLAFTFLCAYPESLFFVLSLLAFHFFWRKQALALCLCAGLLALTRPQGLFLPLAFAGAEGMRILAERRFRISKEAFAVGIGASLGLLAFVWGLNEAVGEPFSFWSRRQAWDQAASNWHALRLLFLPKLGPQSLLPYAMLFSGLFGAYLLYRRHQTELALFCILILILPLRKGSLGDLTRYSLGALFAYFSLAAFMRDKWPQTWTFVLIALGIVQGVALQRWLNHLWVG